MYILKTIDKIQFKISEEEYKGYLQANSDDHLTFRNGVSVKKTMIAIIYPENSTDVIEDRREQKHGILHDGTKVIRHFGQWVLDSGMVPDDKGNYQPIVIDKNYFPEVARDCVLTPGEFEKIKHLSTAERKGIVLKLNGGKRIKPTGEFEPIKKIVKPI